MDEMRRLVDQLNQHGYYYYVLDEPRISDGEYDALYDRLVALERETGVTLEDSPTKRVGGAALFSANLIRLPSILIPLQR